MYMKSNSTLPPFHPFSSLLSAPRGARRKQWESAHSLTPITNIHTSASYTLLSLSPHSLTLFNPSSFSSHSLILSFSLTKWWEKRRWRMREWREWATDENGESETVNDENERLREDEKMMSLSLSRSLTLSLSHSHYTICSFWYRWKEPTLPTNPELRQMWKGGRLSYVVHLSTPWNSEIESCCWSCISVCVFCYRWKEPTCPTPSHRAFRKGGRVVGWKGGRVEGFHIHLSTP